MHNNSTTLSIIHLHSMLALYWLVSFSDPALSEESRGLGTRLEVQRYAIIYDAVAYNVLW